MNHILYLNLLIMVPAISQQGISQRGVWVSFGHPNIHIFCIMQWDEKELDTHFTPNVYFEHPILKSQVWVYGECVLNRN